MWNGLAVLEAGIVFNQAVWNEKRSVKNFGYEDILTNAMWVPVMGEASCRSKERELIDHIGKPLVSPRKSTWGSVKAFGKRWKSLMYFAPFDASTYIVVHDAFDKARGYYVDPNPLKQAGHVAMIYSWDAMAANTRGALLEPFFNTTLPKYFMPFLEDRIVNPKLLTTAYNFSQGSLRWGIFTVNNHAFHAFQNGTYSFFVGAPSSKPKDPPNASCKVKVGAYTECFKSCSKFNLVSDAFHTPTCEACKDTLDAYEKDCGSYY